MIKKKLGLAVAAIALVTAMGITTVGTALAQTSTPPAQATPGTTTTQPKQNDFGLGFGFRGGDSSAFDLVASKLGMTPAELFEALHSGKTLSQIATEKGVDLATIETALNANRVTEMKARLAQAVTAGTITQEEADWWTTGIDKGWVNGGHGGFGFMGGGRHGRGGDFGLRGAPGTTPATPSTTTPPTSSSS
ncbi:MAG: hypothetical protein ACM30E_00425 [Nitrososphaerales archaeon]